MAARPRTLPAAIAPVLVGTAAAVERTADLRVGAFIAALVGSVFIQIGTNLANDYSDARRGADTADRPGSSRPVASWSRPGSPSAWRSPRASTSPPSPGS
jgi:1,4-dihydroxy-2-naphthoate octaprenyltransferase